MLFLSNFADIGLLLPLAGLIALALAAVGRQRDALAWSLTITGTFAVMLVLKVMVFVDAGPSVGGGLNSPSGHTAAGTVVYAGLLTLLGERFASRVPIALLAGAVLSLIFGFARVTLQVHTLADVIVGGAVGIIGALVLARLASQRQSSAPRFGTAVVAAVALFGMLTFYGQKLHAEARIRSIAARILSVSEQYM